jgi:hypothetical protein
VPVIVTLVPTGPTVGFRFVTVGPATTLIGADVARRVEPFAAKRRNSYVPAVAGKVKGHEPAETIVAPAVVVQLFVYLNEVNVVFVAVVSASAIQSVVVGAAMPLKSPLLSAR